jgi:hypothetical protein
VLLGTRILRLSRRRRVGGAPLVSIFIRCEVGRLGMGCGYTLFLALAIQERGGFRGVSCL